jgi:hypothetical protein
MLAASGISSRNVTVEDKISSRQGRTSPQQHPVYYITVLYFNTKLDYTLNGLIT